MSKKDISLYLDKIRTLGSKEYLLNFITYTIAPTINKLKPATHMVFNKNKNSKHDLYQAWLDHENYIKLHLKVDYYTLKLTDTSVHVLFYNPILLYRTLIDEININFLNRFKYSSDMDLNSFLNHLKTRYSNICPHEIGVFLGYNISDVENYIDSPTKDCLLIGYWKVYSDLEEAQELFQSFDEAKLDVLKENIKNLA